MKPQQSAIAAFSPRLAARRGPGPRPGSRTVRESMAAHGRVPVPVRRDRALRPLRRQRWRSKASRTSSRLPPATRSSARASRDLTLIRMTPDLLYDQMIGCGCARKLVFSWGGNPGVGSLHRLRDAVERGWPQPLEIEEHSHSAMAHAYAAGAAGMPCAVFRGYRGSDLRAGQPADQVHRRARSPAKRWRRCRRFGPTSRSSTRRKPIAPATCWSRASSACRRKRCSPRAARDRDGRGDRRRPRHAPAPTRWCCRRGRSRRSCVAPGGARPSYAHGYYARDNAFYIAWDAIARDRETFQQLDRRARA